MRTENETDFSPLDFQSEPLPANVKAFGMEIFNGSKQELIRHVIAASEKPFSYIVTPNVSHIVQLEHNEQLRHAYAAASLRTCDSRILKAALKLMHIHVQEVIPGSDLTEELMSVAERLKWRVTIIGSEAECIAIMKQRYPNVTFAHHNPPMGFIDRPEEVAACLDFVADHAAHLVVLSVGCPRQEMLARMLFDQGRASGVGLCVGASVNFLSGRVKRAPKWMQRMSLEWLHRMCMEPKRLVKRYAVDAVRMIPILVRQIHGSRSR
ncbi:WecB/TagA/CpsF family glycosyltransferase [Pseudomonas matsuisoli]|uniref:Glycosyl transferase n=1 Tax=Pseudomonas matsuisoli TaxID=1515666 RepID=A0A917PV63_9PSED|nr:WecB/TagA/CpsF family glycosyltransferase [Pseudomonas matsuisoli]GGJ93172.1 glycosyl transferase [Pseudomonas matsuisoli]